MKSFIFPAAICIILAACNNNADKKADAKGPDTLSKPITKDTTVVGVPTLPKDFPADFIPGKTFIIDKGELHESLKVQQLDNNRIAYELSMVSKGCDAFTYKGVATLKTGDMETDADEKNNAYEVNEYTDVANGKCGIYIRIGAEKGYTNRARFQVADCDAEKPCKSKTASEILLAGN